MRYLRGFVMFEVEYIYRHMVCYYPVWARTRAAAIAKTRQVWGDAVTGRTR